MRAVVHDPDQPRGFRLADAYITLVGAVLVLFLPETARKELEDISAQP